MWLRFPGLSESGRNAHKRLWSRKLLSILSISVQTRGAQRKLPERCMLVLNHISWLDIFVIDASYPATFIAKSEIRSWPFVGWLSTGVGTLYIERGKRAEALRARQAVVKEIERDVLIALCPEGTTTLGRSLERFHPALFQPALDAEAALQPLALRYLDAAGVQTEAAAYAGETSLMGSVWAIVSERRMVVELSLLEPISSRGETRRSLAEKAEAAIAGALGVPAPRRTPQRAQPARRAPDTGAGPPDGSR